MLLQLRSRALFGHYERKLRDFDEAFIEKSREEAHQNELNFQLANEKDVYFNQLYRTEFNRNLEEKQRFLDLFYFYEKLKDACEMKFRSQILKEDFDLNMLDNVLEEVQNSEYDFSENGEVILYSNIYFMNILLIFF